MIEYLKLAVSVLNIFVTIFLFITVNRMSKEKANNERIKKLEDEVINHSKENTGRLTRLEVRIEQTPTHADLADIHEKVNGISNCVSRLEGDFSGAKNTLDLIHEFLMKGGK